MSNARHGQHLGVHHRKSRTLNLPLSPFFIHKILAARFLFYQQRALYQQLSQQVAFVLDSGAEKEIILVSLYLDFVIVHLKGCHLEISVFRLFCALLVEMRVVSAIATVGEFGHESVRSNGITSILYVITIRLR